MKNYCALFLSLIFVVIPFQVKGDSKRCNIEKVIEDVAVNVVSEAGTFLLNNDVKGKASCRPRDCAAIQQTGRSTNGVYRVWPLNGDSCGIQVYCDLEQDNGGWTVIQRRGNFGKPDDYFDKLWRDYKFGFGNISEDFWMGNDKIFQISNQDNYIMRADLKSFDEESKHAVYDQFFIDSESKNYKLHISGYSGTAGDALKNHTNQMFSTRDMRNDKQKICPELYKAGWWYHTCVHANLNGLYLHGEHPSIGEGINWLYFKGLYYSHKEVSMKIRPKWFY